MDGLCINKVYVRHIIDSTNWFVTSFYVVSFILDKRTVFIVLEGMWIKLPHDDGHCMEVLALTKATN